MDLIYREEAYAIVGTCMEVHRELGMGFLEPVYQEAFAVERVTRNIPFEHEAPLTITYKDNPLKKKVVKVSLTDLKMKIGFLEFTIL